MSAYSLVIVIFILANKHSVGITSLVSFNLFIDVKYLQHETCLARCMVVAGQNEENNEGSFSSCDISERLYFRMN